MKLVWVSVESQRDDKSGFYLQYIYWFQFRTVVAAERSAACGEEESWQRLVGGGTPSQGEEPSSGVVPG